jgi:hypothetical protein
VDDVLSTLAEGGFNTDGQWHDISSTEFAALKSPFSTWHTSGFWGLANNDGSIWMVDVLFQNGSYIVANFDAWAVKGVTNTSHASPISHWGTSVVPVPGAVWLFGTAIAGMIARKKLSK